uniref:FBA_2 domain-containing protein n=1 Tax=Caenorhabditis tropicalis TaxID=1561998 RepID=A0A1I7TL24_9PELO
MSGRTEAEGRTHIKKMKTEDWVKEPDWRSTQLQTKNMKVALDYVRDLFRLPVTIYSLSHREQLLYPQYFGITSCEEMHIWKADEIPDSELKYVLEKVEISKKLILDLMRNDDFEYGFIRFSMDHLEIYRAFWITKETFLAMDCARIHLSGHKNLPIREFVSQWLSSRNTRFEWLKMHWNGEDISWNDGLEPMKWNPAIRGRNFEISDFQRVDCEKGIDFLREDGLLATVVKGGLGLIYFIVWHKRFQPEADDLRLDSS